MTCQKHCSAILGKETIQDHTTPHRAGNFGMEWMWIMAMYDA